MTASASIGDQAATSGQSSASPERRLIDRWFPCATVDKAVKTPAGSGRSEKALFTWFASRPIAQARAAVLTALLPDDSQLHSKVRDAIGGGPPARSAGRKLSEAIQEQYGHRPPVVLDMFSGRGIIPLEAARLGVTAVGTDLSPVATLGGRLLADYPFRDWSGEPSVPFQAVMDVSEDDDSDVGVLVEDAESGSRLLCDVRAVIAEVGRLVREAAAPYFPRNPDGTFPWAYLWAVTIPCDQCGRRFPLVGSLVLRHPYNRTRDEGQSLRIVKRGDTWLTEVIDGLPDQRPTLTSAPGKSGKSARCLFCQHPHTLDTIKSKGRADQYEDELLAVADGGATPRKTFRPPRPEEKEAAFRAASADLQSGPDKLSPIPDELIPPGNEDTVRASGYGYRTYGDLMNRRQAVQFALTVQAIRDVHARLLDAGISDEYAAVLVSYATANLQRRIRRSTRGAKLLSHGNSTGSKQNRVQAHDIFSDESKISFQFDYLETGPGEGPGTWNSVGRAGLNALRKVMEESPQEARPARIRCCSAVGLPFRDNSVDVVVTDPPYYNMIDYSDASDIFYVWFRRALSGIVPDLFGNSALQDKADEIIIKRGHAPGEHRTAKFYQEALEKAFSEARRVLRPDGHMVIVFGHSDPDAWRRLLGALHEANFVVTSSWPSRTETSNTGVASIKVTVTIGCRVAEPGRKTATSAQVDRDITEILRQRVREWDQENLALADQLMAAYGPAMEVYGRYSKVLRPDGSVPDIGHYLDLALGAVRQATAVRVDDLPLESFEPETRFAIFWLRLYGLGNVPKGDARFLAQADGLRLDDLRNRLLVETRAGFKLRIDDAENTGPSSSTFELARAVAAAWTAGGTEAAADVVANAEREPSDPRLWAVAKEMTAHLPPSDAVTKALSAVTRNASSIGSLVSHIGPSRRRPTQDTLFDL